MLQQMAAVAEAPIAIEARQIEDLAPPTHAQQLDQNTAHRDEISGVNRSVGVVDD